MWTSREMNYPWILIGSSQQRSHAKISKSSYKGKATYRHHSMKPKTGRGENRINGQTNNINQLETSYEDDILPFFLWLRSGEGGLYSRITTRTPPVYIQQYQLGKMLGILKLVSDKKNSMSAWEVEQETSWGGVLAAENSGGGGVGLVWQMRIVVVHLSCFTSQLFSSQGCCFSNVLGYLPTFSVFGSIGLNLVLLGSQD
jgi:hypothetical protein